MKRAQLFEFVDQPWLPRVVRACFNDVVWFVHLLYAPYKRAAGPIAVWSASTGATQVLDLGSASAEHIASIVHAGRKQGLTLPRFIVSDLYPDLESWQILQAALGIDAVGMIEQPVRIPDIPLDAPRHWSMFTVLHHFPPETVRSLLARFVQQADGLCIGEYYQRSWYSILMTFLAQPLNLLVPFFVHKPSLAKILWGTLIPVVPLICLSDGIVSVLRTYSLEEIAALLPEDVRDQFTIERKTFWYGLAPMRASLILITRKSAMR